MKRKDLIGLFFSISSEGWISELIILYAELVERSYKELELIVKVKSNEEEVQMNDRCVLHLIEQNIDVEGWFEIKEGIKYWTFITKLNKQSGVVTTGLTFSLSVVKIGTEEEYISNKYHIGGESGAIILEDLKVKVGNFYFHNNILSGSALIKLDKKPKFVNVIITEDDWKNTKVIHATFKEVLPYSKIERWGFEVELTNHHTKKILYYAELLAENKQFTDNNLGDFYLYEWS